MSDDRPIDEEAVPNPRGHTVLLIPRWQAYTVVGVAMSAIIAMAVVLIFYFASVVPNRREYTDQQIAKLRGGLCTALDYFPPSRGIRLITDSIGCHYHFTPLPRPSSSKTP